MSSELEPASPSTVTEASNASEASPPPAAVTSNTPEATGVIKAAWILLIAAWIFFLLPIPGLGLFIGAPLNFAAFVVGIVVLTKGHTAMGIIQIGASMMVSPAVYFIGLMIFGAAVVGTAANRAPREFEEASRALVGSQVEYEQRTDALAGKSAEFAERRAELERSVAALSAVDVQVLYDAYDKSKKRAERRYGGKPLRVVGEVNAVREIHGAPVVDLRTRRTFVTVMAEGLPEYQAMSLYEGERVILDCVVSAGGSLMLERCAFVQ